jgi:AbrB family looped-hinge helix DNA binding protein
MTVTMTSKNQITLPKRIVDALLLSKGALLDVKVNGHHIELTPLEVVEKKFTKADYKRLDRLAKSERKKNAAKKVTPQYIDSLTK